MIYYNSIESFKFAVVIELDQAKGRAVRSHIQVRKAKVTSAYRMGLKIVSFGKRCQCTGIVSYRTQPLYFLSSVFLLTGEIKVRTDHCNTTVEEQYRILAHHLESECPWKR